MIVAFLIVAQMYGLLYVYRAKNKQIEELKAEKEELKNQSNLNPIEKEIVRFLRILRTCGFPSVVNPKHEPHKDSAVRNLWYFKAAMKIKNYDLNMHTEHQYELIKTFMPIDIPHHVPVGHTKPFEIDNHIFNDILALAYTIRGEIETTNWEVFGDAEIIH